MDVNNELAILNAAIEENPKDSQACIDRGKFFYKAGEFGNALNDFLRANELAPYDSVVREYIKMINEILEFRYTDIYNP